jgi:Zn finger protein HypA/HybF involved in hydrogenase expression
MAKIHFRCTKCKFEFTRNSMVTICPYCSKQSVELKKGDDASKLLDDSDY